jgi:enoyl-CoA hydratase/carnithine racemase
MPEVKIGLPSVIEAALLPQLIGWGRTRYLVLTGETVAVADARDWGLFEFVVPPEELDAAVERIVASIVESGPHAVRAQKALVTDWERLPLDQAVQRGIKVLAGAWSTDEPRRMTAERRDEMSRRRKG